MNNSSSKKNKGATSQKQGEFSYSKLNISIEIWCDLQNEVHSVDVKRNSFCANVRLFIKYINIFLYTHTKRDRAGKSSHELFGSRGPIFP